MNRRERGEGKAVLLKIFDNDAVLLKKEREGKLPEI